MTPSNSVMVADIWPVSSLTTALHARSFCIPCIMSRPFDRCMPAIGEVRAPSTELSRRCCTLIRTKGGTWASSAVLRSQSPFREHSTTPLSAQSMGTEPSIGAKRAAALVRFFLDGDPAQPARACFTLES